MLFLCCLYSWRWYGVICIAGSEIAPFCLCWKVVCYFVWLKERSFSCYTCTCLQSEALTPRCSIKCHRFSVVPALCSQHLRWLVLCLVELFMVFRLKYSIYIKTACSHFFSRNGMLFCILNSSLLMGLPCPWMYSSSSFSLALLTSTKVLSLIFPILQCR